MHPSRPKYQLAGLYIAVALIAYAVAGALFNDIYLPGRRTDGIHLHYEAVPPALLGITLIAFKLALDSFTKRRRHELVQWTLTACAIISFAFSFYFIARPSGKALASTEECQATFEKLSAFVGAYTAESVIADAFHERSLQCSRQPILKSYHQCVMKAKVASDVNGCHSESEALFNRRNAT